MSTKPPFRRRTYFVSGSSGLVPVPVEQFSKATSQSLESGKRKSPPVLARLVIADCRLLSPSHPANSLLLKTLRPPRADVASHSTPPEASRIEWTLRRLAPWIAAAISALAGFIVFLGKAG